MACYSPATLTLQGRRISFTALLYKRYINFSNKKNPRKQGGCRGVTWQLKAEKPPTFRVVFFPPQYIYFATVESRNFTFCLCISDNARLCCVDRPRSDKTCPVRASVLTARGAFPQTAAHSTRVTQGQRVPHCNVCFCVALWWLGKFTVAGRIHASFTPAALAALTSPLTACLRFISASFV